MRTLPLVRSSASCLNRSAAIPFGVSGATTWLNLITIGACAQAAPAKSSAATTHSHLRVMLSSPSSDCGGAVTRRDAQPGKRPGIRALLQTPACAEQRFDGIVGEDRRAQRPELVLEIAIGHRPREASERVRDEALDHAAVLETNADPRRVLGQCRVDRGHDAVAQRD